MKSTKSKNKKKDVFRDEDFQDKNVKVRITTFIDMDILKALKSEAGGRGYQTILNEKLRESLFAESEEKKITRIVERVLKRKGAV